MSQRTQRVPASAHLARQFGKTAAFYGLHEISGRMTGSARGERTGGAKIVRTRPSPNLRELLGDVSALMMRDAAAVRSGLYPAIEETTLSPREMLARVRTMLRDVPDAVERRQRGEAHTVNEVITAKGQSGIKAETEAAGDAPELPEYYQQDFHFQKGGWLSDDSAKVYDLQVETLFLGAAAAMRRQALRPIAEHLRNHDQRATHMVDVACGTGRLIGEVKQAFPLLKATGVDLSQAYLREAERHLAGRRGTRFLVGNAEALPLEDNSADILTCVYLFHELPHDVRRTVAREFARVLRPGGLMVFIDSLQWDDRPGWDGLLEVFPQRFHEPYYEEYLGDPADAILREAGLEVTAEWPAFLSKVVVARAAGAN